MTKSEPNRNTSDLDKLNTWTTRIGTTVNDLLSQFTYLPANRATIFIVEALKLVLADVEHTLSVSTSGDDMIEVRVTLPNLGNIVSVFDLPKEI